MKCEIEREESVLESLASTTNKQRADLRQIEDRHKEQQEQMEHLHKEYTNKQATIEKVEGEILEVILSNRISHLFSYKILNIF